MTASDIARRYRNFSEQEAAGASPLYATLAATVAEDPVTCESIAELPERCHQPNLLLAAVRFVTGTVPENGDDLRIRISVRWNEISEVMRSRYTQTNEPGRCAAILLALQDVPEPIALIEVGASAGLCLLPDRYAYRYRGAAMALLGSGACVLDCEVQPGIGAPQRIPEIGWRRGLDQNPLDLTNDHDMRWLRSLVWPDMRGRAERLDSAIDVARQDPPRVLRGDLAHDLRALLDEVPEGLTPVVVHSAVLAYLDADTTRSFVDTVAAAGAVRIGLESPGASPAVAGHSGSESANFTWGSQFVLDRDGEVIAGSAPHGSWIGPPPST